MDTIVRTYKLRIKAKNTADIEQRSLWSKPLLTSYARSDKKRSHLLGQKQIKL